MTSIKYLIVCAGFLLACSTPDPVQPPDFEYVEILGQITERQIDEVSGIAISNMSDSVLWVINDSGDAANIYAITRSGELLGAMHIQGAHNRDWEDMDSFIYDGTSYLLMAETGDNDARYDGYHIYVVQEPVISAGVPEEIEPAWQIDFDYPDGARDCEAVAVDLISEKIFLLSKREVPPKLFELPLAPTEQNQTANYLGEVTTIPQPGQDDIQDYLDQFSAQPTAMDISADGAQLVVLTYKHLFLYNNAGEDWPTALTRSPVKILYPRLVQAEAACFDNDQQKILITTENVPAPVLQVDPEKF